MREAGRGRREAGGGKREARGRTKPFAQVMADQAMATPEALAQAMRQAIGDLDATLTDVNETLRAAEKLLDKVLDGACESRESALDLLAVDALVTRAMQLAAQDPKSLSEFPEKAMKRIATR
ncbi:MAG: hypothetical protein ACJ8AK_10780 [Gemmatimonadaceae bacterium]